MSNNDYHSFRRGDRLDDAEAHRADHGRFGRRGFLRNLTAIGTGALVLNKLPLYAFGTNQLAARLTEADSDRVLVFIRLKGGNDGLNTFLPVHDFGQYQSIRPDLYVPRSVGVTFSSTLVGHPQLRPLEKMWNDGAMRVVHNVGYPEQNLSHFRSSDIWATSSDSDELVSSGLLGRYLEDRYPAFLTEPPEVPPAIQIGGQGNLLFNNSEDFNYALSTENPTELYNIAKRGALYDIANLPECTYGEQLGYLRAVANTTFRYAGVLAEAYEAGKNGVEYAYDSLGDQLSLVARMLRGGLGTRLFVVEIDGFDTHANQAESHARLLRSVATNVAAFYEDLSQGGHEKRVLAVTFSEFGRRIEQNGSMGTDHGAAAPLMIFGPALEGNGVAGGLPDLRKLDRAGNLIHSVDFRSVYATVLSRWLCLPDGEVDGLIGAAFPRIDELGLFCEGTTSTTDPVSKLTPGLNAYRSAGDVVVEYELPRAANVRISFFDAVGRRISSPFQGRSAVGANRHRFSFAQVNWSAGVYVVSMELEGRVYSKKIALF